LREAAAAPIKRDEIISFLAAGSVSFRATIFDGIGGSGKPLKRIA
jgi:hypothetical protein